MRIASAERQRRWRSKPGIKEREAKRAAEWRKHNRSLQLARTRRCQLESRYGITPEQYDTLLNIQGGVCAISGRAPNGVRLAVDHDHKTGAVRGLLDPAINRALGNFGDDPDLLEAAANYLRKRTTGIAQ